MQMDAIQKMLDALKGRETALEKLAVVIKGEEKRVDSEGNFDRMMENTQAWSSHLKGLEHSYQLASQTIYTLDDSQLEEMDRITKMINDHAEHMQKLEGEMEKNRCVAEGHQAELSKAMDILRSSHFVEDMMPELLPQLKPGSSSSSSSHTIKSIKNKTHELLRMIKKKDPSRKAPPRDLCEVETVLDVVLKAKKQEKQIYEEYEQHKEAQQKLKNQLATLALTRQAIDQELNRLDAEDEEKEQQHAKQREKNDMKFQQKCKSFDEQSLAIDQCIEAIYQRCFSWVASKEYFGPTLSVDEMASIAERIVTARHPDANIFLRDNWRKIDFYFRVREVMVKRGMIAEKEYKAQKRLLIKRSHYSNAAEERDAIWSIIRGIITPEQSDYLAQLVKGGVGGPDMIMSVAAQVMGKALTNLANKGDK